MRLLFPYIFPFVISFIFCYYKLVHQNCICFSISNFYNNKKIIIVLLMVYSVLSLFLCMCVSSTVYDDEQL